MSSLVLASCTLVLTLVGTLVFLVGFSLPNWQSRDGWKSGLWQFCSRGTCFFWLEHRTSIPEYLRTAQITTCFAFICVLVAVGLCCVWLYYGEHWLIIDLLIIFLILSGLLGLVGVSVYGTKVNELPSVFQSPVNFGLWLTAVGSLLFVVAAIVAGCGVCCRRKN